MEVHIGENKPIIAIGPRTFHVDLPKTLTKIDFIIKHNELSAAHTIKNKISPLLSKYKHGNNIHEHGKQ